MEQTGEATETTGANEGRGRARKQPKNTQKRETKRQSLQAPERGGETCHPPTVSQANYKNASCAAETYAWARPLQ